MNIKPVRTEIIKYGDSLEEIITNSIESIPEKSVLAITSKAFSFTELSYETKKTGSKLEKYELVRQEADYYLEANISKFDIMFTIKGNSIFVNAGIDESNSDNSYTLWPKKPQKSVNRVWKFIRKKYGVNEVGVIMTDSKSFPLSWGVVGHGIAHCGFYPLKDYRGTQDIHGRTMIMEQLNLLQSFAAAACLEMGEGNEQQPMAIISDISQDITWQNQPPTKKEISNLYISLEDDIYAPLLTRVPWKKGTSRKKG